MSRRKYKKSTIYLAKSVLAKHIRWVHDFDYLSRLSEKDREWMSKFIGEYYNGYVKKGDPKALHNTLELKRDCWRRKNRENRDLYSLREAWNLLETFKEVFHAKAYLPIDLYDLEPSEREAVESLLSDLYLELADER